MPTYRGVTVHVTDGHDNPLPVWGTQKRDRSHLTTCYIQSENNMAFRVSIKAELPFEDFEREREEEERKRRGTYERDVSDRDIRDRDVAAGGDGGDGGEGGEGGEGQGREGAESMSGRQPEEDFIKFEDEDEEAMGSGFVGGYDGAYDEEYHDEEMTGAETQGRGTYAGGALPPMYDGANDDPDENMEKVTAAAAKVNSRFKQLAGGYRAPVDSAHYAEIHINDYQRGARSKVCSTLGAIGRRHSVSITQKGRFYEEGVEPLAGEMPKLYVLVEADAAEDVEGAADEIVTILNEDMLKAGNVVFNDHRAPHGYYGALKKDPPAQDGRIKMSLKALQRPVIVKQEAGSSTAPARGRALEAFDGPRIKEEPSSLSPPGRPVRDGDRLRSPKFVYPPTQLKSAPVTASNTMTMKDIEDDTLWQHIQQQSRRYPNMDVETLLHDATRTKHASRARKCLSEFKASHTNTSGGIQQHDTRHDYGDPPRSPYRSRSDQQYPAYDDIQRLEDMYAKERNLDRLMTLQDIEDDKLRKHLKTLKKRHRGWDWEELLLDAANGSKCPFQAVECLQKFADAHYIHQPAASYHLLATLRLDGKKNYEKRSILYLDWDHKSEREVKMFSRTILGQDGTVRECKWYFREVGIDTIFDKLLLGSRDGNDEAIPANDDEDLLAAFGGLGADGLQDAEEKLKAGQIELTLERVTVGATHHDVKWNPDDEQDQEEIDLSAGDVDKVSHTFARDVGKKRKDGIHTVEYNAFCPGEPPFATFRFYYRGEEKLRKFNFDGFPAQTSHAKSSRMTKSQRKEALTNIAAAPLSITAPNPPQYVFNDDGQVIAEIDVPKVDSSLQPLMSVEEILEQSKASSKWTPANNKLPVKLPGLFMSGSILDPPDSPPDSPIHEDVVTDESMPVDQKLLHQFRMMDNPGEEGDDEASEGGRTPGSMGFRDDNGSGVGEDGDDGRAGDGNDEGIGERLGKIELRKRHTDAKDAEDVEESSAAATKKPKV
ncbi:hypothetical protein LTR85_002312 [Meristemomyces frigidus]|nr:hypothetical protein LTR85_002312 [Meristemomyces frigidus]